MTTTVVHMKRKDGEVVQDCDVYIGRACNMGGWRLKKSEWHNPFFVKEEGRQAALDKYEKHVRENEGLMSKLETLRGKRLGCWCAPDMCHGDVLVKLLDERDK